jgi:ribonuclease P protein component
MHFPRRVRLTKPLEFKRVFQKPRVSSDAWFKVMARVNEGPCSRLGMAVSRQVDRRAVARNRLKRIIRESFRSHHGSNRGPSGGLENDRTALDYVVLPRREAASISNDQLFRSLKDHWQRLERKNRNQRQDIGMGRAGKGQ